MFLSIICFGTLYVVDNTKMYFSLHYRSILAMHNDNHDESRHPAAKDESEYEVGDPVDNHQHNEGVTSQPTDNHKHNERVISQPLFQSLHIEECEDVNSDEANQNRCKLHDK